ncbi:hypothetical protein [Microbacterium sp. 22242]|uniref:hypothetical protein n=1 Tax=Microbacterium sp. 22242 TaxID=3453896 RepID=UPI003F82C51E
MKHRLMNLGAYVKGACVAGVLAVVVGIAGCASDEAQQKTLNIASIAKNTTAFQAEILQDGKVTPAEYESAVLAYRTCVQDAGAEPGEISEFGNNELGFTYTITAAGETQRKAIEAETEQCLKDNLEDIGKVWSYQNLLSPKELDRQRPEVAACLRSVGIDINDSFSIDDLRKYVSEHEEATDDIKPCVEKYPGFFSINPAEVQDHHDESTG